MEEELLEEQLRDYDGSDKVISSFDMAELIKKLPEKPLVRSLIPSMDEAIEGFEGGELTVVSGPTGNGKTLLCQTLTHNFGIQNQGSVWFTYEVTPKNFIRHFGNSLPLFYLPQKLTDNSNRWIRSRVLEAKVKYGCDCVFIDHLHYLVDMKNRNMSTDIGVTMRDLKKMALALDMKVFLISHMMKTRQDSGEPSLGDVRDSSFIEQESDNVFYVWRMKENNVSTVKIAKNRRCGVMGMKIKLSKIDRLLTEVQDVNI